MYYVNTLKHELIGSNACKLQASLSERVVIDKSGCHTELNFGIKANDKHDKVLTLY